MDDDRQPAACHSLPTLGEPHPFTRCEGQALARGAAEENTAGTAGNEGLDLSLDRIQVEAAVGVQSRMGGSDQPCQVSHPSPLSLS